MYLCGMKKAIVYMLLFIFTIQTTKSLWIVSSFHINREYIADNLCINRFDKIPTCKGQCFLDKELTKENKESKKALTTLEKEVLYIIPDLQFTDSIETFAFQPLNSFGFYQNTTYISFLLHIENPPELLA